MSKCIIIKMIIKDDNENFYHKNQRWEQKQIMNVKLRAIVNYLIGFFYVTEKKYSCSITKIGKLLSILAFKAYVKNEKNILGEYVTIKKYKDCGTYIPNIFTFSDINSDIYISAETITTQTIYNAISSDSDGIDALRVDCQDTNDRIMDCVEYNESHIPSKYKLSQDELTIEEKELSKEVFVEYGAFSPDKLGKIIGDFCQKANVFDGEGNVDLKVVRLYRYADDTEGLAIFIGNRKIE